jgi:hypothetical protein
MSTVATARACDAGSSGSLMNMRLATYGAATQRSDWSALAVGVVARRRESQQVPASPEPIYSWFTEGFDIADIRKPRRYSTY